MDTSVLACFGPMFSLIITRSFTVAAAPDGLAPPMVPSPFFQTVHIVVGGVVFVGVFF
jgi:hypothetical protein